MPPTKKPEIERLNPKLVARRIMALLPKTGARNSYVQTTIQALHNHSNGFLLKPDLDAGRVHFTVNVSYSQLAEYCGCDFETAKWRCRQLRDKWKLITWSTNNNPKLGNDFIVDYSANRLAQSDSGNRLPQSDSGNEDGLVDMLPLGQAYSGNRGGVTQVIEQSDSGNRTADSGNRLPPLSLNCLRSTAVERTVHQVRVDASLEEQEAEQEQHQEQLPEPAIASLRSQDTDQEQEQLPEPRRDRWGNLSPVEEPEDPNQEARREANESDLVTLDDYLSTPPVDSSNPSPVPRPPSAREIEDREYQIEQHRVMAAQHRWEDDKPTSRCWRCTATYGGYLAGADPEECPGSLEKKFSK